MSKSRRIIQLNHFLFILQVFQQLRV